jgi:hypothetical protein
MDSKPWWQSRQILVHVAGILGVIGAQVGFSLPPETLLLLITNVIGIFARVKSDGAVLK